MPYTLKTTGLPSRYTSKACLVVNQAGDAIVDLVSGNTIAIDASVTLSVGEWNAIARKYFTVLSNSFDPRGVTWTGTQPSQTFENNISVFIAYHAINDAASGGAPLLSGSPLVLNARNGGTGEPRWNIMVSGSRRCTATVDRIDGKASVFARAGSAIDYGLRSAAHGASLSSIGSAATDGFAAGSNTWGTVSSDDGQAAAGASVYCVYIVQGNMTDADADLLHTDWFGEILEASGGGSSSLPLKLQLLMGA